MNSPRRTFWTIMGGIEKLPCQNNAYRSTVPFEGLRCDRFAQDASHTGCADWHKGAACRHRCHDGREARTTLDMGPNRMGRSQLAQPALARREGILW